jgi:hypothetical protein
MGKPHKHVELIKAWADGATIQFKDFTWDGKAVWIDLVQPAWTEDVDYRIKPEPTPDIIMYGVENNPLMLGYTHPRTGNLVLNTLLTSIQSPFDKVKFTFDGKTGELKSAEVLF